MLSKIHPDDTAIAGRVVIDDKFCKDSATALTVWNKSLLFSCSGFTVYDPSGNLVFRVESYCSDPKNEVLLMDAAGMALLTMRRKDAQKPLFVVKRASSLRIPTNNLADVYVDASAKGKQKPLPDYHIKGCYAKRSFTFLNKSGDVIAEVKPKQVRSAEIKLGGDVFNLVVWPGYDQAFVMGLIIILDQIMPSG